MRVEINKYIVADSEICHGKPTFNGTRVMVWQVLEMLEGGVPVEEIITSFITPLTKEHVKAALHYASIIARGSDNVVIGIERHRTKIPATCESEIRKFFVSEGNVR